MNLTVWLPGMFFLVINDSFTPQLWNLNGDLTYPDHNRTKEENYRIAGGIVS